MTQIKLYHSIDKQRITDFQNKLKVFTVEKSLAALFKKSLILVKGVSLNKTTGRGSLTVIFSPQNKIRRNDYLLSIDLSESTKEDYYRKKLLEALSRYKKIKVLFKSYSICNKQEKLTLRKYIDQVHPEAVMLSPICIGKGIDVGCGFRKTHPKAIGVDWIGKGELGTTGNVKGRVSEADIRSKGDNLKMFKNNSLDYVVARHNLEHYHNPEKTLEEWLRVLKRGGYLGIVVPNSTNPFTAEKTHYYNFTLENFKEMLIKTKQVNILKIGECIPGWSYYCIASKIN